MLGTVLRSATATDFDSICALNAAEIQHTSAMDVKRLSELHALACYHKVACVGGGIVAFLLAIGSGAACTNENFEWFSKRYPRFIYIDRIVVAPASRGLRLGSLLYEDLFRQARREEFPLLTCEYNLVPPNEPSRVFHDGFGFKERGTRWVANGVKQVSLQAAET